MLESFFILLFAAGVGQGIFLSLMLLLWKKGNHRANYYLSALTLLISISLIDYIFEIAHFNEQLVTLRFLLWPKEFFYGVLIYFYARELTQPNHYELFDKQWRHFIPAMLHVTITWSVLSLSPERQYSILYGEEFNQSTVDMIYVLLLGPVETILAIAQIAIYLILSFKLLKQHRNDIKQTFSDIERINLSWLRNLLIGLSATYVIWVYALFTSDNDSQFDILVGCTIVALIYAMAIIGIRQPTIFTKQNVPETIEQHQTPLSNSAATSQPKYKNSPLTTETSHALLGEITSYMTQHKPYLNNELSLPQLAEQLELSSHYLSQIINEQLQQNFFDFVNYYRIEEAKSRLTDTENQKQNILNIAMDVGFNSKSAFYTAFKKFTNMTPSQYRQTTKNMITK